MTIDILLETPQTHSSENNSNPRISSVGSVFINQSLYGNDVEAVCACHQHYLEYDFVKLPGFLATPAFALLYSEICRLRQYAFRRDFKMECMGASPRHMSTLSGDGITELSTLIPLLYQDPDLLKFLSLAIGQEVLPIPDIDRYVLNDLHAPSDTFGAHYDDYPISLTLIFEAPLDVDGGDVELVARASSLDALLGDELTRFSLAAGDAYILKSDTSAHRVAPLKRAEVRRTSLNFAYTFRDYSPVMVTPSAQLLYLKGYKMPVVRD